MENIRNKIETAEISIYAYEENGVVCGYELNTYTRGGLNQIVFVDFRQTKKDPNNPDDFKKLFLERVKSIDVDEEIEINRQNDDYKKVFTISQSVKDIKRWKKDLKKLAKSL